MTVVHTPGPDPGVYFARDGRVAVRRADDTNTLFLAQFDGVTALESTNLDIVGEWVKETGPDFSTIPPSPPGPEPFPPRCLVSHPDVLLEFWVFVTGTRGVVVADFPREYELSTLTVVPDRHNDTEAVDAINAAQPRR